MAVAGLLKYFSVFFFFGEYFLQSSKDTCCLPTLLISSTCVLVFILFVINDTYGELQKKTLREESGGVGVFAIAMQNLQTQL